MISSEDINCYFQMKIKQVESSLQVSPDLAFLLYKKYGSFEIIKEKWEQNSAEVLQSLHITSDDLQMKMIGEGECPLCLEKKELCQLYCGHKVCKNCLISEIKTLLDDNQVPICREKCEHDDICGAEIIPSDISNLFSNSQDVITAFNCVNMDDLIRKDPNVRLCPQCNSIITKEHKIGEHFCCCPKCKSFACFECHDDFHGPMKCDHMKDFFETQKQKMEQLEEDQNSWFFREKRCQQYRNSHREQFERYFNDLIEKARSKGQKEVDKINQEKSLYNNIISSDFDFYLDQYKRFIFSEAYQKLNFAINDEETINIITTRCPKCREYVERNGGCNHMTCRCGCQFCYSCGAVWDSNHSSSKCPKYASRTDTRKGISQCGIDFNNTSDQNFYPPPMNQEKRQLFVMYKNLRILYQQFKEKFDKLESEMMSSNSCSPKNKLMKVFMLKYDEKTSINFVNVIINAVLFGQKVVMYGYPEMFYVLSKENDSKAFESHLNQLDKEVENLVKFINDSSDYEISSFQPMLDNIHGQIRYLISYGESN